MGRILARAGMELAIPSKIKREAGTTIRRTNRAIFIVVPPVEWKDKQPHGTRSSSPTPVFSTFV
jgi:hypothetical protein